MIKLLRWIIFSVVTAIIASFQMKRMNYYRKSHLHSVDEWLQKGASEEEPQRNVITVRFINNLSGKDITIDVEEGSNLLAMGDLAGVKLPRACRTGLCGSCTCEVQDPQAIATPTNPRDGFATIRACSAKCYVPPGMEEMVIDVYRMKNRAAAQAAKTAGIVIAPDAAAGPADDYTDPMARFSGDWEKEFRPQWELAKIKESKGLGQVGAVGAASDPKNKASANICKKCQGAGRVVCYACNGTCKTLMGTGKVDQCAICIGRGTVGCGSCRGTGNKK